MTPGSEYKKDGGRRLLLFFCAIAGIWVYLTSKLCYTETVTEGIQEKTAGDDMSSFKDVVGHKNIIQYIENAVKTDKVSHAYILNGEKGSGKRLLANLFAMSLQCQNRDEDGDACGKCQSCKQAASNNQPDIIRVTHEKPNTISIDDIREQINNDIVIKPYSSKYKIYIVPDADMMSVQAQNALLKTIEEPPAYAVILLLTENAEILLPTIRSRCVMLKLRNIKDQLIKNI